MSVEPNSHGLNDDLRPQEAGAVIGDEATLQDAETGLEPPILPTSPEVVCRRCGKSVAGSLSKCVYCDAKLPSSVLHSASNREASLSGDTTDATSSVPHLAITRLIIFYAALLSTNVIGHWIVEALHAAHPHDNAVVERYLPVLVTLEAVDVIIVLLALALVPRPPQIRPESPRTRTTGWIMGPVILAILL